MLNNKEKFKLSRKINVDKTVFDIPIIKKQNINLEDKVELINFTSISKEYEWKIVHMFCFDKRLETLWNLPSRHINKLKKFRAVLSPDFSAYIDMPQMYIMWNIYRSRWIGAFWQINGINVIPTITWARPDTYMVCFAGIEQGSIVTISTIGVLTNKDFFMEGYREMIKRIKPSKIICYGEFIEGMEKEITIVISYESAFVK